MLVNRRRQRTRRTLGPARGLTLVDLVVTVLIVGVVASVAAPSFLVTLNNYQLQAAARRIASVYNYARQRAKANSQPITLTYDTNADSIALSGIDDPNHPGQAWTIQLATIARGVDLVAADFGGSGDVTCEIDGRPNVGGLLTLTMGSEQTTVSVSLATGKATVP